MQQLHRSSAFSIRDGLTWLCLLLLYHQLTKASVTANTVAYPSHTIECSSTKAVNMQWRISYFNTILFVDCDIPVRNATIANGITISASIADYNSLHSVMSIQSDEGKIVPITVLCTSRVNGVDVTIRNVTYAAVLPDPANELLAPTCSGAIVPTTPAPSTPSTTPVPSIPVPTTPSTTPSTTAVSSTPVFTTPSTAAVPNPPVPTTPSTTPVSTTPVPTNPVHTIFPLTTNTENQARAPTYDKGLERIMLVSAGTAIVGVACLAAFLLGMAGLTISWLYQRLKHSAKKCDDEEDIYDYADTSREGSFSMGSNTENMEEDGPVAMTINDSYSYPTDTNSLYSTIGGRN